MRGYSHSIAATNELNTLLVQQNKSAGLILLECLYFNKLDQ